MMIDKQELKKLEKLAKLKFDESELEKFNDQLNDILNYMKELDELDLSNIEPLSNILSSINFFREDKVKKTFEIGEILKNAPEVFERQFVVPKVI
ncbi:MAG: Asp-tRNA(Asn)/Glu-tRNA(Gln) amidotransferase subunit GatC [Desulfurella sp.]|nr:glutamyl-tRNA amidotransferase subunit C [Desulfurella acetivorans A63]PMP68924.1 MAG: Asp-tRNA(Asn)/Glu-tRNA(Gln) amidotransferase subunit GatC [Desulfurella multipotens]PMP90240.1 MAG: Asp-tRNA(Asn)/Glu-tRNA(Gln) amidotransferase subunit GatC [Desulfurella sp.]HEX14307.1 Asp-tRNA(Asn)/Glu-tRNA(Gln) amidotransferase subunit GatC [Desulfurella acetivorans]